MPSRFLTRNVGGNTTYARNLKSQLEKSGIEVSAFGSARNPLSAMVSETVAGIVGRPKGVVMHYVADTGPLMGVRSPSILTVHGVASRWIATARSESQEAIWRYRVGRAIRATQELVTVSETSAEDIAYIFNVDKSRITVIHHGIDHEAFARKRDLPTRFKQQLPNDFVLYLGNLEPRKNLIALIQAFNDTQLASLGIPLVIAGRPAWNYGQILEAIKNSQHVIYLGFVSDEDRAALMQASALFAFPSLYEGFGFPVLEAMSAGTPVLTSDRGSLKDLAGPARVLSDLSPESLGDGISRALADTPWLKSVGPRGQEWARRFSWEASAQQHLDVYRRSVG